MNAALRTALFALISFGWVSAQPAPQDNWTLETTFAGGTSNGLFTGPTGVAIAPDGKIVVVDSGNNRIQVFNPDGTFVRRFGTNGSANGQFSGPFGVAVQPDGKIVVADAQNARIQVFNADGTFALKFGSPGSGDGQFNNPWGVAIAPDGKIVVADRDNNRIQVFNVDGSFVRKWGSYGYSDGQFYGLSGVAVTSSGNIIACDNYRLQVFASDGAFTRAIGSPGTGPGQFQSPSGVAVTGDGKIVVADTNSQRVQIFASDGSYQSAIGGVPGSEPGALSNPRGVAIDLSGQIVVADSGNNRIQVFSAAGEFVRQFGHAGPPQDGISECRGMVVDANGNIYVAESMIHRIQVLSSTGALVDYLPVAVYINCIHLGPDGLLYVSGDSYIYVYRRDGAYVRRIGGGQGSGDGQMDWVIGVSVDTNGDIYAADMRNSRVDVFAADGTFLRKFGEPGTGPGQFNGMDGIALTPDGRVAVSCSSAGNQISYFSKQGSFIERDSANSGIRTIGPDGLLYTDAGSPCRVFTPQHGWLPEIPGTGIGLNPRTGTVYTFDPQSRRIQVWRRGFRTLGANPPKLVPMPGVRGVNQRANGYIDIDYLVTDGASATVQTAIAAFKNGSTALRDLVPLSAASLVEDTAGNVGAGIATGQVKRVTWDASSSALPSGSLVFEVFARDDRPGLIDLDFVTVPGSLALTISRTGVTHADMRAAWAWLLLNNEPGLARAGDGEITGPGGTFTSTDAGGNTMTTAAGRAWLLAKLGVREATTAEVNRARLATATTTPNRFATRPSQRMGNRPSVVNEWTIDTGDYMGTEAWWVVPIQ